MIEDYLLYLSKDDIVNCLTIKDTIVAIEDALRLLNKGKALQPSKVYMEIGKYHGFIKPMIAFVDEPLNISATKNFSFFPENRKKGLPTVLAMIILNDPETGLPLAIMDGTLITS